MNCVSPPAGSVSPRSVPSRPLLQPQLSGADPRGLPGVFPLQSEEPDHQDPAGEQVSLPELSWYRPVHFTGCQSLQATSQHRGSLYIS